MLPFKKTAYQWNWTRLMYSLHVSFTQIMANSAGLNNVTHTRARSFIRVNEKKMENFTKLSFIVCLKCWTFVIKLKSAGVHRIFFSVAKKSNKKYSFGETNVRNVGLR